MRIQMKKARSIDWTWLEIADSNFTVRLLPCAGANQIRSIRVGKLKSLSSQPIVAGHP
ncbi:hypothetical protein GCM10008983_04210 [Lentibacillus halophilus]|uniref:Uncharacterized protein n=1 Tax=Lentibacillus halophilus TaxID=295065 RepID=A0ABN0Z3K2_9BACI